MSILLSLTDMDFIKLLFHAFLFSKCLLSREKDRGSSIRRNSGTFLSIPFALKRKKSLNELFPKSNRCSDYKIDVHTEDMDIDENQNINTTKTRTLACFYPSSIRASKDLDKTSNIGANIVRIFSKTSFIPDLLSIFSLLHLLKFHL